MASRSAVLRILADGDFHSGTDMGRALGVTRAAVSKAVATLVEAGLEIHRVSGRGYRLENAFDPLDQNRIRAALDNAAAVPVAPIRVIEQVDSTSLELLRSSADLVCGEVCVAEAQRAGRGRRGRSWVATPYANLMLSMAWRFDGGFAAIAGLSLAAGVATVRALREFGVEAVGLKWPNDLLWGERKLGGLLVDLRGEAAGPCLVVAGIGINVRIAGRDADQIDQPWIDLAAILERRVDRNRLAAELIRHLAQMFRTFERDGLAPFREEWSAWHHLEGRRVHVTGAQAVCDGVVEGIDANGALLVRDDRGTMHVFNSGEVSVRPLDADPARVSAASGFPRPRR